MSTSAWLARDQQTPFNGAVFVCAAADDSGWWSLATLGGALKLKTGLPGARRGNITRMVAVCRWRATDLLNVLK